MKKLITTVILLTGITLNVFAQQEIPMFFDSELGLQSNDNIERRVVYSPDGSKIATVLGNGKITIWDSTSGREITRIDNNFFFLFSPNGRQLVTFSTAEDIIIWDAASGVLIQRIQSTSVRNITFSPNGDHLAEIFQESGSNGIRIWNIANGTVIKNIEHSQRIWSATYSPNGMHILAATNDGIIIWSSTNGNIHNAIGSGNRYVSGTTKYNPNGRYAAYAANNIALHIFNTETNQETRVIPVQLSIGGTVGNTFFIVQMAAKYL